MASLEPLVFLDEHVYAVSRDAGSATLVSALGVRHPLRMIASSRIWQEHSDRLARPLFEQMVAQELIRQGAIASPLIRFLAIVAPRAAERDWGAAGSSTPGHTAAPAAIDAFDMRIEAPRVPAPSLVVLGRVWLLVERPRPAGLQVIDGARAWALTGEWVGVAAVLERWRAELARRAEDLARSLLDRDVPLPAAEAAAAREELASTGAVRRGVLLFIRAEPPLLGHLLPPHFNHSLHREVRDDVAVAVPYEPDRPAVQAGLIALERSAGGSWREAPLPRGLCIGHGLSSSPPGLDRDLGAVAYLRSAAARIAANGRFHEHDGRHDGWEE